MTWEDYHWETNELYDFSSESFIYNTFMNDCMLNYRAQQTCLLCFGLEKRKPLSCSTEVVLDDYKWMMADL